MARFSTSEPRHATHPMNDSLELETLTLDTLLPLTVLSKVEHHTRLHRRPLLHALRQRQHATAMEVGERCVVEGGVAEDEDLRRQLHNDYTQT